MNISYLILVAYILTPLVFVVSGVLLMIRNNKKAIRCRSPLLLNLAHWNLMFQAIIFLVTYDLTLHDDETNLTYERLYVASVLFLHWSNYLTYILRCYRLYFIFNLGKYWNEEDHHFKKHSYRASQRWLFKIFTILILPILILSILVIVSDEVRKRVPLSYKEDQKMINGLVSLPILFLEELVFVVMIYNLRNVKDYYNMTPELVIICGLWMLNSLFPLVGGKWQLYSYAKVMLIMAVSTLWPIIKSFKSEIFDETLTQEVIENLELILINKAGVQQLELFIQSLPRSEREKGLNLLRLWYSCQVYNCSPTTDLEQDIANLACEISDSTEQWSFDIESIRMIVFNNLKNNYYTRFRQSIYFKKLSREIFKMRIYMNRIMETSFVRSISDYSHESESVIKLSEEY